MVHAASDVRASELVLADPCVSAAPFVFDSPRNLSCCHLFSWHSSATFVQPVPIFEDAPGRLNLNLMVRVVNWDEGGREREYGGRKRKSETEN